MSADDRCPICGGTTDGLPCLQAPLESRIAAGEKLMSDQKPPKFEAENGGKLMPCAHCGGVAELARSEDIHYVQCSGCGMETSGHSFVANAVKSWNTRVPAAALRELERQIAEVRLKRDEWKRRTERRERAIRMRSFNDPASTLSAESPILAFQAWCERWRADNGRKLTQTEYGIAYAAFIAAHPGEGPHSHIMEAGPTLSALREALENVLAHLERADLFVEKGWMMSQGVKAVREAAEAARAALSVSGGEGGG